MRRITCCDTGLRQAPLFLIYVCSFPALNRLHAFEWNSIPVKEKMTQARKIIVRRTLLSRLFKNRPTFWPNKSKLN